MMRTPVGPGPSAREYEALVHQGLEAMRAGRAAEAEAAFAQVASTHPKDHRAWHMLAVIALQAARPHDAVGLAQRALAHDRRNPAYRNTLGIAVAECGMFDDAIGHFRRALREQPSFVDAGYNLGKTLYKIGDLRGAREAYTRALAFDARHPGLRPNLANVLRELGDLDAAITLLEEEAAEAPGDDRALAQLARAWRERSGSEAAIAFYRSAIERVPRSAVLRYGLARLLLARGAWREGWTEYLWRDLITRTDPPPDWETLPGELSDARIRLIGEQGLGDVLFFARFAPELKRRGAWLGLECHPKLVPLLRRSPVFDEVGPVDGRGPGRPGERRVFLGDLPAMLGAQTAPAPIPLTVDRERVARLRAMLAGQGEPPFIGLTWRAGTDPREPEFGRRLDTLFKEIDLDAFATAFGGVPGTLVVVQRNARPEESSRLSRRLQRAAPDFSALNEDLAEMSALLAALDDYVGVSNTNVHLAAGVGKRARVLVPYPPEWRWLEAGDESQWFPGCKTYRQSATRSWDEALARLRADLLAIPSGPPVPVR